MTAYLCVGGPLHGQMYDLGHFESEFVMEEMRDVEVYREQPGVYRAHPPVRHTYRRRGIGPNCVVWLHHSIPVTL